MFQGSQIHAGFQGLWQRKRDQMDRAEEIMLLSVPFSETGRQILHYIYSDAEKTQESCHCGDFANLKSKGNTQKWENCCAVTIKNQEFMFRPFAGFLHHHWPLAELSLSLCVCVIYCMDWF